MLVKDAGTGRPLLRTVLLTALLSTVAVLALLGLDLESGTRAPESPGAGNGELHRFLVPRGESSALSEPADGLHTLHIGLPEASARRLQSVRDRALETGIIVQEEADTVPATLTFEDRELAAEVRIKGDWLDHVSSDQWSLRVTLDEAAVLGLRVFSLQAPETVGHLWEWVVHAAARREDVLAPRSTFVHVVLNGNDAGVYFLQEHFAKELLEAQRRREGPIVRWDETTHWDALLQHDLALPGPPPMRSALVIDSAPVKGFGAKRLAEVESLARGLDDAVEKMRQLRALAVSARTSAERLRRLEALEELRASELERILNIDRFSCAHAVASLFQLEHPLYWHNMRFYHDPVLERLEPILFDCMAHQASDPDPVPLRGQGYVTRFQSSRAYYDGVFRHIGRLVKPGYVEAFLEEIAPDLARFEPHLPAGMGIAIEERLLEQRDYLARLVLPVHGVNFAATYSLADEDRTAGGRVTGGLLEVRAWATTRAPMVVEGFRFSNGSWVDARSALSATTSAGGSIDPTSPAAVVLPHDGRGLTFRFPIDARLASLESIRELKRAVRRSESGGKPIDLAIDVLYRSIASRSAATPERLAFRPVDARWSEEGGRPAAPTIREALERHPFLVLDPVEDELVLLPGTHEVEGDLVLPERMGLSASAGTRLAFGPGAVLLASGPLRFEGREDAPIVLCPRDPGTSWGGVQVLEASARSRWSQVVVRRAAGVARHGWLSSGGVTFYRSPVDLSSCRFEDSPGEDALNVFATDVRLEGCRFEGSASDSFDGDFITGEATGCVFLAGKGDGLDLSGSTFRVVNSRFEDLGDKAISAGEGTRLRVEGGLAKNVSIGVASKDGSDVHVSGFGIEAAEHHSLAVYVKKTAFGPARLEALRMRFDERGARTPLVQTGCTLVLEGELVPTTDLDVERLYREGVLGR